VTDKYNKRAKEALTDALRSVDWNNNVSQFLKNDSYSSDIAICNFRLAVWAKQFETLDKGNPALSFIREMQNAGHYVAALTSLALYKPAASMMRITFDTSLYYTYFRTHPCELATLSRDDSYFVWKNDIIDYHKLHTPDFAASQSCFGLIGNIKEWYARVSAIVHGQIPGAWVTAKSLAETSHNETVLPVVVKSFVEGEELVHQLFLCTVGRELWNGFSSDSKRVLIAGLSGETKATLCLDAA
jgi:hypothetical protein